MWWVRPPSGPRCGRRAQPKGGPTCLPASFRTTRASSISATRRSSSAAASTEHEPEAVALAQELHPRLDLGAASSSPTPSSSSRAATASRAGRASGARRRGQDERRRPLPLARVPDLRGRRPARRAEALALLDTDPSLSRASIHAAAAAGDVAAADRAAGSRPLARRDRAAGRRAGSRCSMPRTRACPAARRSRSRGSCSSTAPTRTPAGSATGGRRRSRRSRARSATARTRRTSRRTRTSSSWHGYCSRRRRPERRADALQQHVAQDARAPRAAASPTASAPATAGRGGRASRIIRRRRSCSRRNCASRRSRARRSGSSC